MIIPAQVHHKGVFYGQLDFPLVELFEQLFSEKVCTNKTYYMVIIEIKVTRELCKYEKDFLSCIQKFFTHSRRKEEIFVV